MALSRWKQLRYRLEWLACTAIARGILLLPRRACVPLARGLGALAYRFDKRGRAVALDNLRCAFGDQYTPAERARIARRSYQNFVRTLVDLLWARRLTPENWHRYMEITGPGADIFAKQKSDPRAGIVFMCIHWGNFEWASLSGGFQGAATTIVVENFKNPSLGPIVNGAREVSGQSIIPQENSMIRLLKIAKRKGATGVLIDLTLRPDQAAVGIEAFGMKMSVTSLHAILAQRAGAQLIAGHGESLPDGRCRTTMDLPLEIPPGANTQEIAQLCWDHFEPRIRKQPELWMWAYKHWRYRPKDADPAAYPFYANASSKFDKMLAAPPAGDKRR